MSLNQENTRERSSRRAARREQSLKIGIIGVGNIGGTLTRRLTALGHTVHVANSRGPESLGTLATETGAVPVPLTEIAQDVDMVIVSIPLKNMPNLPSGLLNVLPAGVIVVDTSNYSPKQRDGKIEEIENGMTESRWTEVHLGHPVVKAFNTIFARHLLTLGEPSGTPGRTALPVAGDDALAKAVVIKLLDQLGFDAVDAGSLDDSWRMQMGTPVSGRSDMDVEGVRNALAAASPERSAEWRA